MKDRILSQEGGRFEYCEMVCWRVLCVSLDILRELRHWCEFLRIGILIWKFQIERKTCFVEAWKSNICYSEVRSVAMHLCKLLSNLFTGITNSLQIATYVVKHKSSSGMLLAASSAYAHYLQRWGPQQNVLLNFSKFVKDTEETVLPLFVFIVVSLTI